jgi:shikimate dehydrogenase
LIYNPGRTRFLMDAEKSGLKTINGLPMLIGQAEESFKIWTGIGFSKTIRKNLNSYFSQ